MQVKERDINLDEIFFNVRKQDVFTEINGQKIKIPSNKVLVNAENDQPISIVSNSYEIVTNKSAYEYGLMCIKKLFNLDKVDKVNVYNISKPNTKSFCHIDIFCPDKKYVFKDDEFFPFVRITNSYNKMFKLQFRIGVCRWICKNGMIFDEDSIKFSYSHMKGANNEINFDLKANVLEEILKKFKSDIEILSDNKFNYDFIFPMIYKGLGIKPYKEDMTLKQKENAEKLNHTISILNKTCQEQNGENFYSVYNILTDISTRGIEKESFAANKTHHRQLRAGKWVSEISEMLRKGPFNYTEYLKEYIETVKN